MHRRRIPGLAAAILISAAVLSAQRYGAGHGWWSAGQGGYFPWEEAFTNSEGQVTVVNSAGAFRTEGHPFFEPLGSNGRACITCHQPADAMSISAAGLQERWKETDGKDPVFAAIDGSNCPDLPQGEASSHSLLLKRGLFRIATPWPPRRTPEFRIEVVRDPTGCNKNPKEISVYRRPRMAANLDGLVPGPEGRVLMADGRAPSLEAQAINAVMVHEQAAEHPTVEQLRRIVDFESSVYAGQSADIRGGLLVEKGGPDLLVRGAFASFDSWRGGGDGLQHEFRASVARGSDLFRARCATCHSPGTTRWMDIGTANRSAAEASPDLPLFRVTCTDGGRVIETQDPGRALVSGRCADVGAIVAQQLRGLAARAPYFANGSAGTLREVVDYYDRRLGIGYSAREKQDLVHFLGVL